MLSQLFSRRKKNSPAAETQQEPPVLTKIVPRSEHSTTQLPAQPVDQPAPMRPDLLMTPYLQATDIAVTFANPELPDEPLVDVNDAFCRLTGYDAIHALNRNCRFLQGELTPRTERTAIRQGIKGDYYLITRLLNYRRNGELFDNVLQVGQIRDTGGHTRFLFGLQWDITRTKHLLGGSSLDADLLDRTLSPQLERLSRLANHLVRRSDALGVGAAGIPLVERLAAMSRPFQFPTQGTSRDRATLRMLLEYLIAPHKGDPRSRFRINGSDGVFDTDIAGPLALWLHELAVGSREYGALSESTGLVILSWTFTDKFGPPMIEFHWQEVKFASMPGAHEMDPNAPINRTGGTGARVVRDVVEFAGGRCDTRAGGGKLESKLVLPNVTQVESSLS